MVGGTFFSSSVISLWIGVGDIGMYVMLCMCLCISVFLLLLVMREEAGWLLVISV